MTLASGEPTEVITGYGILKTTEDLVPMLVQRRRAQQTAFIWTVSLDGAPVTLRTEAVSNATGTTLPESEAVLVNVAANGQQWSLLANPQQTFVETKRSDGTAWHTTAAFAMP